MIVQLLSNILPGIFAIILNNLIITRFGSEVNGLLATFSQILVFLTIFEGALSLATNVKLYSPYLDNDFDRINEFLTATRIIFFRIGIFVLAMTLIIPFFLPFFIRSSIDDSTIKLLFMILGFNLCIKFFTTSKYQVLFYVAQKEYIINSAGVIIELLSLMVSIYVLLKGGDILTIKSIAFIIGLIRVPTIFMLFKRNFPRANFKSENPNYSISKSTSDVLYQNFTFLIFNSTDLIVISTLINTLSASVYAVYNMIFTFIKRIILAFVLAPFNAFGQLAASGNNFELLRLYKLFQFFSISLTTILLTSTNILVIPFIRLYTRGVSDINYVNHVFSFLFTIYVFFEITSNILGLMSNSAGKFKEMKSISAIGAVLNIVFTLIFVKPLYLNGVLLGSIVGYSVMLYFQIKLVHIEFLKGGLRQFLMLLFQNIALSTILVFLSFQLNIVLNNYLDFFLLSISVTTLISIIVVFVNIVFHRKTFNELTSHLKRTLMRK